ncbi:subtilisin-like protease SBT1.8 [Euphorbia lathyris]|uniref:subtilisin-like protease SBT1.8 n=1 Tax=Euphorbia lathyris TaxID=212925 RepID=UPI00331358E2
MFGYTKGIARGMAVRARIAAYKVCGDNGQCNSVDILSGMDQAIKDGVHIMCISIGLPAGPYLTDLITIDAYFATRQGVLVCFAGGNSGPTKSTVANVAPWGLTVAAGTIDRDFPAYAILGNKHRFSGEGLYNGPRLGSKPLSLIYHKGKNSSSNYCLEGTLEPELVRGKVVVCDSSGGGQTEKGLIVQKAGGAAMILVVNAVVKVWDTQFLLTPGMVVGKKEGDLVKDYIKSVTNPTVIIGFGGTAEGARPAPVVGAFSSRGPNSITPEILKPDILAPGVNILAAYSEAVTPKGLKYVIISGTSMACPHVSGVVTLLKAAHPNWSPSALKSAIMTTAYTYDNTNSPITDEVTAQSSNPWAYGSGHIDPKKAFSPGLVYDNSNEDYITFWCSLGYSLREVRAIVDDPNVTCSTKFNDPGELNYPSFSVLFTNKTTVKYTRELTNVGVAKSTYKVAVSVPPTVTVTVTPSVLEFKKLGDKQKYAITFVANKNVKPISDAEFGSVVWSYQQYKVRSPIAFTWK